MKSASTYLQALLWENAEGLAEQGILYPQLDHYGAFGELVGGPEGDGERSDAWTNVRRQIRQHAGDVILSNELLAATPRAKIRRIVEAIPAEVHVVLLARDLGRVVPSHWQTTLRNGRTHTWADFAAAACRDNDHDMLTDPTDPHTERALTAWFWRHHDVPAIVARWRGLVPLRRMAFVTVPPSGSDPELVARRFASVVGATVSQPEKPPAGNPSMGAYSAELLRRLNERKTDADEESRRFAFKIVMGRALTASASKEPQFGLSPDQLNWMTKRSQRMVEGIDRSGIRVVGDLEDLIPAARTTVALVDPSASAERDLLEAASDGMLGIVGLFGDLRQDRRGYLATIKELETELATAKRQIARKDSRITNLVGRPSAPPPSAVARLRSALREGRLLSVVRRRLRR